MKNTMCLNLENVKQFNATINGLRDRVIADVGCGLIFGNFGTGKTRTAVHSAATSNDVVYIRAALHYTYQHLLERLIVELGAIPARGVAARFRQAENLLKQPDQVVIIDEVDLFCRKPSVLGLLRDLFDMTGAPIVLMGHPKAEAALAPYGALMDRVTHATRLAELSLEDVKVALGDLGDVSFTPEATEAFYGRIEPRIRALVTALLVVEDYAQSEALEEVEPDHVAAALGNGSRGRKGAGNGR